MDEECAACSTLWRIELRKDARIVAMATSLRTLRDIASMVANRSSQPLTMSPRILEMLVAAIKDATVTLDGLEN